MTDATANEWVGKASFASVIKTPPKRMASTPKSISASQPCKPVAFEKSSQNQKRAMSTSPEIVQEKAKIAKNYPYTRESFLKKPTSKIAKFDKKGSK